MCIADGEPSPFPDRVCYRCVSATAQTTLTGPDTTNHCSIQGECVDKGAMRPSYYAYNQASVCESCDPEKNPMDWSIDGDYFHDRTFQLGHDCKYSTSGRGGYATLAGPCALNNYGILFTKNTNGCQILPEVPVPSDLTAALAKPTTNTVAAIGERITNAISAARSASSTAETQLLAAWYN